MAKVDDNQPTVAPHLRFPEFREAEGWRPIPIGDKIDLLSGFPFDGADISEDNSGTKLLRGINITEGAIRHSTEIDRYFHGNTTELKKFELIENDLVIGMDGSKVGKNSALISSEDAGALLIQRVARLRTNDPNLIKFIFLHINSSQFHRYVDKINTSSGIPHISAKQIRDFTICFPSEHEQQKIAECLSSLDEVVAAQGRKVEALKAHKRSLMQQLFPQEGETVPRLRFPEFRDAPEWNVIPLEQVATYENGKAHENSISEDGRYIVVNSKFISTEGTVRKHSDDAFCVAAPGDILMVLSDVPNGRAIAKCFYVDDDNRYTVNQRICKITPSKIDGSFLFHILDRNQFFIAFDDGVKQTNLRKEDVLNCPICCPQQREEQETIGRVVSWVDKRIAAESEKLAALKTHKRGLMQQLFPVAEG